MHPIDHEYHLQSYSYISISINGIQISRLSLDTKQYPEYRKLTVRALNSVRQSLETVLHIKCAKVCNTEEDLEISIKNPTDPAVLARNPGL